MTRVVHTTFRVVKIRFLKENALNMKLYYNLFYELTAVLPVFREYESLTKHFLFIILPKVS